MGKSKSWREGPAAGTMNTNRGAEPKRSRGAVVKPEGKPMSSKSGPDSASQNKTRSGKLVRSKSIYGTVEGY